MQFDMSEDQAVLKLYTHVLHENKFFVNVAKFTKYKKVPLFEPHCSTESGEETQHS